MTTYDSCRGCGAALRPEDALADLGALPLANSLLTKDQLDEPEVHYRLRPLICRECFLVQLPALPRDAIFGESYPFFAGASGPWHGHCSNLADWLVERFGLTRSSRVLEIGSNDGSLLRCFRKHDVPAVGVEPCASVAQHAAMEGLATIQDFWGLDTARRLSATQGVPTSHAGWKADVVVSTNVLAHVPDLQDFLAGVREILAPGGHAVFEVAYLHGLVEGEQFDQIYAEHYSYFSVRSLRHALANAGLVLTDVEFVPVHGGSIRATAARIGEMSQAALDAYRAEAEWMTPLRLLQFQRVPGARKREYLRILGREAGRGIVGYGASAKASTLLAYLGVGPETIAYVVDTTPSKWGRYLPGSRIPIRPPDALEKNRPGLVVNLLWNWRDAALRNIQEACPGVEVLDLHAPKLRAAA